MTAENPQAKLLHLSSDALSTTSLVHTQLDSPPTPLDLTLPMSDLLREGTKRAHVTAEHSDGAKALATGQLELTEYIRYLTILWMIYVVLERELEKRKFHPILKTTYKPKLLARSAALIADIAYLSSRCLAAEGEAGKLFQDVPFFVPSFLQSLFVNPPAEVTSYQSRIKEISCTSPELLLSHTYVRYLGDLSGGQLVGSRMRKRYHLLEGKKGTEFYEFEAEEGELAVNIFERKKQVHEIKDWFRTGVDLAVGDDQELKSRLVEEAIKSFEMSTRLLFLLQPSGPPSDKRSSLAPVSAPSIHNTPGSLIWMILALLLAGFIAHFGLTTSGTSLVEVVRFALERRFKAIEGRVG